VKRNLFLALKESLNNMVRHSGAAEVRIRFVQEGERFSFEIADDGKGLGDAAGDSGNGLRNMKKRMQAIGADFGLVSAPGKGVTVAMTGTLY
jgi:two-component system sensor histidine kinase UhpB